MAQNITINGESFSDVPSISVPKTGGGTASFVDTTDATASESTISNGYTAYVNGVKVIGTASGGGDSGGGGGAVEKKDVNFIDYDGTLVYSYTASEFAQLTAMPANPSHTGLTAQGWNWTLANAKTYVASYGKLNIGQMYVTSDGKTRIYVHFEKGRSSPYFGIGVNGSVSIDWGDGSSTSTLTGTSLITATTVQHVFEPGDYIITLTVQSGSFSFIGVTTTTQILKKSTQTTVNISRVYANAVQRVEMGTNAGIGSYAFNTCYSLASITIPNSVTSIGTYAFYDCCSLASITIPNGVTSIGNYTFRNCYSLASITIPNGVTSIGSNAFYNCAPLASVTIPNGVTSIGASAFYGCYSLASITIPNSVTSIGGSAFQHCYSLTPITIPNGVTSIGNNAFYNCYSLASVTIPNGVTSIGNSAIYGCYSLASITIPNGVTSIGTNAFYNCYGMAEYHMLPTTPPSLASTNAFTNIQSDCIIYVPASALNAYKTASNWSTYASYMVGE